MNITDKQKESYIIYNTDKFRGNLFGFTKYKDTIENKQYSNYCFIHSYKNVYNELFNNYEYSNITLLEIGILFGGSVRLFSDYFKRGKIVGIDHKNRWFGKEKESYKNLSLFYFNAYDEENLNILPIKEYNFIIDDGSHKIEDMLFCLDILPKYLKEGGVLIIEDISTSKIDELLQGRDLSNITIYNGYKISGCRHDNILLYRK